jgi:hypothetical protein
MCRKLSINGRIRPVSFNLGSNLSDNQLSFVSAWIKYIIDQACKDVMTMLSEKLNDDQRIQITDQFNKLVASLNNELYLMENTINDTQIHLLLEQTKMHVEKFKEIFSSSTLTVQSRDATFGELIECITGLTSITIFNTKI